MKNNKIRVLFVCHGNICRSPMAEFLFKDYVRKKQVEDLFVIESAATSSEEIGNSVHYGTKRILDSLGIDCSEKTARKVTKSDYDNYDYIIGMDEYNIINLKRLYNDKDNKIFLLLEFAGLNRGIRDPWYTGNFKETYEDVMLGIEGLFSFIMRNRND